MQENNSTQDSAIKLFGKKIPLKTDVDSPAISGQDLPPMDRVEETTAKKDFPTENVTETSQEDDDIPLLETEESADPDSNVNPKTPSIDEESAKSKTSKTEKEDNNGANEKTLKKPDKILPCPRCNSMETKFCYYNNYNINQPRHFCKACQRYWTAGGTMRNVPVGAGRRKNKNSASHYCHITISEALQAAHIETPNGTHNPGIKTNGRVLSFGFETPICTSMASVLSLADKKVLNAANGCDDCSSGSSVTVSNSVEEKNRTFSRGPFMQSVNGFSSPFPCLPGFPWPYQWSSALPSPPFCPPGFAMPFYPPFWNMPLLSPQSSSSSSSNNKTQTSPDSPLGKHSREGDEFKPDDFDKQDSKKHKNGCVLVPKVLRIDDPNEAAKSSIWATLGIKNETCNGGKLFKAFQPKLETKNHAAETSPVLLANPAALSRSINFHESS